jgi:hypothetical protein
MWLRLLANQYEAGIVAGDPVAALRKAADGLEVICRKVQAEPCPLMDEDDDQ